MTNRDLAFEYLKCFCAGDVEGVAATLAPGLCFRGPLLECASKAEYVNALRANPPAPAGCHILGVSEGENTVAVFYDYDKPGGAVTIAQLFGFEGGAISEVLVVFDTASAGE